MKRRLLILALFAGIFTACKKEASPEGNLSLTGRWELTARSNIENYHNPVWIPVDASSEGVTMTFSSDHTWKSTTSYGYEGKGTFHTIPTDDPHVWKVALYNTEYDRTDSMQVEILSRNEIRWDLLWIWCGTGYTSSKFTKQ